MASNKTLSLAETFPDNASQAAQGVGHGYVTRASAPGVGRHLRRAPPARAGRLTSHVRSWGLATIREKTDRSYGTSHSRPYGSEGRNNGNVMVDVEHIASSLG